MRLCLRTQHVGGRYRTPTSRFGVRDSTPRPPRPLEYMLTCGMKGHYILPLSDLSKTIIVMTRIPRVMIHGIVQVLVNSWFYNLTRPSRKRTRVTKTPPLTPNLYIVKLGFTEGIHYFLIFALKQRLWVRVRTTSIFSAVKYRSLLHKYVSVMLCLSICRLKKGEIMKAHLFNYY